MAPKTATPKKNNSRQPKISQFGKSLRSRNLSEPADMASIFEEDEYEANEENPLSEDSNLQDIIHKINGVCKRLDNIENFIKQPETGVKDRLSSMERKQDVHDGKVLFMAKEHKAIKHDMQQIKGVIQRHATQLQVHESKVTDLTARSMAKNLLISGIVEDHHENCKEQVRKFLLEELDINIALDEDLKIKVAHRLGFRREDINSDRAMIIKVNDKLKELILNNIEHLEGRKNRKGKSYYINIQQPEAKIEAKRNAKALLKRFQEKFKSAKVEMRGDKVYMNNEWQRPLLEAPRVDQLFYDPEEQKQLGKLKILYSPPVDERSSNFWAAACRVDSIQIARQAYKKIRQDHPTMSHISAAVVSTHEGNMTSGLADDLEHGAGFRILRKIREVKQQNIVVFVARKFGGEHIGGRRFEIIEKVAEKAIQQLVMFEQPQHQPDTTP